MNVDAGDEFVWVDVNVDAGVDKGWVSADVGFKKVSVIFNFDLSTASLLSGDKPVCWNPAIACTRVKASLFSNSDGGKFSLSMFLNLVGGNIHW